MKNVDIKNIIEKHIKWINNEIGGERAAIYGANLSGVDLSGTNLSGANLSKTNLYEANLSGANLSGANLCEAILWRANLYEANLCRADLQEADLQEADLSRVDLSRANLCGANLSKVNLSEANLFKTDLSGANLFKVNLPSEVIDKFFPLVCPEFGAFIGWKQALVFVNGVYKEVIIKLKIPEDAKRSSGFGRKCRCNKAVVLDIENLNGDNSMFNLAISHYDNKFYYRVGEIVSVDNFDTDRTHECSYGIHFFITRQEAIDYS